MTYTPPSVRVTSIANSRIINISEDARLPALVGPGPATRTITDTPIARGSAGYDLLPTSGSTLTITKVASYPGASGNNALWANADGTIANYDTSGSASLYWSMGQTPGSGRPLLGETYYVSYTYPVPASQYDPQTFTDSKDVRAFYGSEDTGIYPNESKGSGSLAIGANMALENGAPAVICVQLDLISDGGSLASSLAPWTAAFSKLEKKDQVAYLVPLVSGSTNKATIHSAAITHVNNQSSPDIGHERSVILGAAAGHTLSTITTNTTAIADRRVIYMAPGKGVTRTLANGTVLTLDGAWVGAAMAGVLTSQDKIITPATGKIITGFVIPDNQYSPYEMNLIANNGACVVAARGGIAKIRHAVTTDPTNADTREISVVAGDDYVRRVTRNKLTQRFIGKGIIIDDGTIAAVEATISSIWGAMVRDRLILNFGTKTDPTTGEVPISAARDASEPTRINVTGSISFLYPLNYITVEFFVYV